MQPSSQQTFAQRLAHHARSRPGAALVIDRDHAISAGRLQQEAAALAAGLAGVGVGAGDRVAIWLPNCAAWITSFLACAHLGALVLAVNTRFRSVELADIIDRGRADWLVLWPDFKGIDFEGIFNDVAGERMGRLRGIVAVREGSTAPAAAPAADAWRGLPVHDYRRLLATSASPPAAAPDGPVLCFTTSGTTSLPKFVVHDQATLLRHGDAVAQACGYDGDSRVLAAAPFCGAFGFATLVGAFAYGAPIVCEPVFGAQASAAAVRRHRVTHTFANNEALVGIMRAAAPGDLASARLFGFASFAPGMDELHTLARDAGVALAGLYGSSELQALAAIQPRATPAAGSPAQCLPGGMLVHPAARVRARDPESGELLATGQSGELEIRSPSLMQGYLDDPQATAKACDEDGYFRTGDLGYALNDRQFVFQARMGDSLRLSGFLVNPAEIERVVEALPGVRACQVVGAVHDGKTVPYAFVLLHASARPDAQGWRAACRKAMAGFKVPVAFTVLDEFPSVQSANSVKIQRYKLREMAERLLAEPHASVDPKPLPLS
ncbi:AMP-binding protein [Pigmentiphaga soli]|uniref:AMP-binding protein n=1 Tax=Pigmentiphaga soli TaxID=1007095 RepID=A0ABP8HEG8_9BURK